MVSTFNNSLPVFLSKTISIKIILQRNCNRKWLNFIRVKIQWTKITTGLKNQLRDRRRRSPNEDNSKIQVRWVTPITITSKIKDTLGYGNFTTTTTRKYTRNRQKNLKRETKNCKTRTPNSKYTQRTKTEQRN